MTTTARAIPVVGVCAAVLGFLAAPAQAGTTLCPAPGSSHLGCEFYAVSLPNPLLDQTLFSFGIGLGNPGPDAAQVTISGGGLSGPLTPVVGGATFQWIALPWVSALSTAGEDSGPPATSIVEGGAYRIVSDAPLTAVQLNAILPSWIGGFSGTNDGSLLFPTSSAGTEYRVAAPPSQNLGTGVELAGFLVVVALSDATTVIIEATGAIVPGAGLSASGGTVVLDQSDVLLVSSEFDAQVGVEGSDLSGTRVASSAPVLVWSGHAGAQVPLGFSFVDHTEESVPPVAALATDYLVVRPWNPVGTTRHFVKIVGVEDGTTLITTPSVPLPTTLNTGQSATVEATTDFRLHSSKPLLVSRFMVSQDYAPGNIGDPAQDFVIPTAQGLRTIDLLAPQHLHDGIPVSLQVVAPEGAVVELDGTPVGGWTPIAGTQHAVARVATTCCDLQRLQSDVPVTASVIAYPEQTSYWFPAGAGLASVLLVDGFEWGDTSAWSTATP